LPHSTFWSGPIALHQIQAGAKVEVTVLIRITVIVSSHSEVLPPTISTWKNSCWIMRILSKETQDRSRYPYRSLPTSQRLIRTSIQSQQRIEELMEHPTSIHKYPVAITEGDMEVMEILQKSPYWELQIDFRIVLGPLGAPPHSTLSAVGTRRSRASKNW
jgi:hypothetical protein